MSSYEKWVKASVQLLNDPNASKDKLELVAVAAAAIADLHDHLAEVAMSVPENRCLAYARPCEVEVVGGSAENGQVLNCSLKFSHNDAKNVVHYDEQLGVSWKMQWTQYFQSMTARRPPR